MQDNNVQKNEGMTGFGNGKQKPQAPNWLINNIAEASRNARKIYFLYIGSLVYCALTIVSTSDRQIILNEKARLPIVNLDVSLNGFFILSPIILLIVFAYLQLYLQRLKGLTSDLRENYAPVEKRRLYPWMLNIAEDPEPGIIGRLQIMTVSLSLWILLPIVLNLNAFWFIKKHDFFWSYVICILSIIITLVVFWFWSKYEPKQWRKPIRWMVMRLIAICFVFAFEGVLIFVLIPWAKEGGKGERYDSWLTRLVCVDLSYQKLITEPEKDKDYEGLYWGNFREIHMEGAILINSVLKKADLVSAHLRRATMLNAILQRATLFKADLQGANLWGANLMGADLLGANLMGAKLGNANLQRASFGMANLQRANLWKANLQGANLMETNLQEANLRGANLKGANLWKANLQGANLMETHLQAANLEETNLQGVEVELIQLSSVSTLYEAKLDESLLKEIVKNHSHLLREPKLKGK